MESTQTSIFALLLLSYWLAVGGADHLKYKDPRQPLNVRVNDLLSRMTLTEKIGQMAQIAMENATAEVMAENFIGSVLSGGGHVPAPKASAKVWVDMVNEIQKGALSTRLGIPMIYGIDAVHGHNNVYKATIFPHNVGLGATRDPALVKRIGAATALEVRATGIPYVFAPCVARGRYEEEGKNVTASNVKKFKGQHHARVCYSISSVNLYFGAGTTLLDAIKSTVDHTTEIVYSENPDSSHLNNDEFSYAIVAVGEHPYAESFGDNMNLTIPAPGPSVIQNVCRRIKCVVVVISGRPLVIEPYLETIDALVAAWLPGTEGQGVADVLFGDYGFSGVLSRTWFRSVDQLPMNVGDPHYDPLYPFGFGLKTEPAKTL